MATTTMPTDYEIARAQRAARAQARADAAAGRKPDPTTCPFDANSDDGKQRVLAMRWAQAYVRALPDSESLISVDGDE